VRALTHASYSPVLVAVSFLIAVFASYTALDLASSVSAARGRIRTAWLAGGSLAMGVGIWSMHFVGMLAFRLPGTPIAYDIALLVLSIVVAIAASAIALVVVSRRSAPLVPILLAGLAMGGAICGMHYIGIWSMRLAARVTWEERLVAASITIAIVAAFAALWLAFRFREPPGAHAPWYRLAGGLVMGVAISGMHYTAMLAMRFTPLATAQAVHGEHVLATNGLAVVVTGTTLMILIIALGGSVFERALAIRTARAEGAEERVRLEASLRRELEESEARFRFLAEASIVLAASFDYHGTLMKSVARLAVQHIADFCLVDVVNEDTEEIVRVAVAHRDAGAEEALRRIERFPPGPDSPLAEVLRYGRPRLVAEVTNELLRAIARNEEHLAIMREFRPRSAMIVPLNARGHTLGIMTFVSTSRPYTEDDLELAEELARRAALAVDNARLYRGALVANQAKSDFLAVVSHELRTPLNAILGYTDLLEAGIPDALTRNQRTHVGRIDASARHLLELVTEILTFARLEAGKEEATIERVDVAVVLREVAAMIEPLAHEKGLQFVVHAPERLLIETDAGMIRQMLLNLLANAVKFTERGGIELSAAFEDDVVVLQVRDTGIGIPPEHRERIFSAFWQVEQGTTRRRGGTGLGLTVTRRLAQLLGGDVSVESELRHGSTFRIRVPTTIEAAIERGLVLTATDPPHRFGGPPQGEYG
jgi:signal transduction histidine kinase/NO-binding membrane sensor protein with MHYT domain